MKLEDRYMRLLEFCAVPRSANEIAVYLCINKANAYKDLAHLQKTNALTKAGKFGRFSPCFYVASHDETVNHDLIRCAHNPFGLTAGA